MTGAENILLKRYSGLFIFPIYLLHYITLFEVIPEIIFGKRHDPGPILTQKTEDYYR